MTANPQAMILAILAGKATPLTLAEIHAAFPAGEAPLCGLGNPRCYCQIEHALIFLVARRAVEIEPAGVPWPPGGAMPHRRYSIRRPA